jgi:hypothetical protein
VSAAHGPEDGGGGSHRAGSGSDGESLDTGGAGRGGGLLFVAVLVFVAYLAFEALLGLLRFAVSAVLLALAVMLLLRVLRRR